MIKCVEFPNKTFATKEELFDSLREHKKQIIDIKCSTVYKSFEKGLGVYCMPIDDSKFDETTKSAFSNDKENWNIAVNTTKILDSHRDLHIDGIWNKTKKEQQGKNYLVDTHVMSINTTIAKKGDISIFTAKVPFSVLGYKYEGNTEALIYRIPKNKICDGKAKDWLESGDPIEGSVRMQYVKIDLAMNSKNPKDKAERDLYDEYIDTIANKADFDEIYYFWVVKEAKNIGESSLVLAGSNYVTGVLNTKENTDEPLQSTQTENKENSRQSDTMFDFKQLKVINN